MKLLPFEEYEKLSVDAAVMRTGKLLEFVFQLEGDTNQVLLPAPARARRTSGLWQTTCFEAFISTGSTSYIELNFAPSGEWGAYEFTGHRQGMRELALAPPRISFEKLRLVAAVEFDGHLGAPLNLAAVIESSTGLKSYWALAHPKSDRPDFHARDCFVANLP
jgi:hypothetical protein